MLTTEWNLERAQVIWKQEGEDSMRMNVATNALKMNMSTEMIVALTGLPVSVIEELRAKVLDSPEGC